MHHVSHVIDFVALSAILAAVSGYLPLIFVLIAVIWFGFEISRCGTMKTLRHRLQRGLSHGR